MMQKRATAPSVSILRDLFFGESLRTYRSSRNMLSTKPWAYESRVEAEPMARYRYGGYHPVHLGDLLKNGRYKIIHKLGYGGYGGYSTVWLARDLE